MAAGNLKPLAILVEQDSAVQRALDELALTARSLARNEITNPAMAAALSKQNTQLHRVLSVNVILRISEQLILNMYPRPADGFEEQQS